jgi:D-alanyl-D-alanine carboxypeptidase
VRAAVSGILVVIGAGCGRVGPADSAGQLGSSLQALLDSTFAANTTKVPGLILRVEAPSLGLAWSGAVGSFDKATGEKLRAEHTVRMASNTKTYIATAILRLVEQGRIGLDSAAARYSTTASVAALRRGGYDPATITIRHLLNHTSGLFDYAMAEAYFNAVSRDFSHRWTRQEQLGYAVDSGKPVGKPAEVYHYSDTGYILLGEIIETVSGKPMGTAVRELIGFDRLGITSTYFESLDSVPPGTPARAHQYLDTADTYHLDPSHDLYGGGGLVSNVENMARFYRALVRGEIFEKKETLDAMLLMTPQSEKDRPGGYGMGIGRSKMGELTCYGHSGYWGTAVRHCPEADLTVAVAMNRSPMESAPMGPLANAAVKLVTAAMANR